MTNRAQIEDVEALESAVLEANRGSLEGLDRLAARDPSWQGARDAYAALAGLASTPPPWPSRPTGAPTRAHIVALGALAKLAAFSLTRIPRPLAPELVDVHEAPMAAWTRVALAWEAVANGAARPLATLVAAPTDASLRVEDKTLQALSCLGAGDLVGAVTAARSAARMAHAEGIRGQEYLAYFALARARRHSGLPYAAARILVALRRGTPAIYGPLIDVERALAGDAEILVNARDEGPAGCLREAIAAAREGSVGKRDEALARLELQTRGTAGADVSALCSDQWPGGEDFLAGVVHDVPASVAGAAWAIADLLGATPGIVLASPASPARRVLALNAAVAGLTITPDDHGERVASAAAILAMAGPEGLDEAEFFRLAYGFSYVHATHDGVVRVLVHRLRAALGNIATIERGGGRISMTIEAPLAVHDPRTRPAFGDRVLRLVASRPGMGARDIAARLGSSIRSVQEHLALLIDTGACASSKDGRRVGYTVEDTTFSEPTHLRAPRPG